MRTGIRLADFSYAGYASGERPIPVVPVAANVRDFGARGDGRSNDTAAFKKAISPANLHQAQWERRMGVAR